MLNVLPEMKDAIKKIIVMLLFTWTYPVVQYPCFSYPTKYLKLYEQDFHRLGHLSDGSVFQIQQGEYRHQQCMFQQTHEKAHHFLS